MRAQATATTRATSVGESGVPLRAVPASRRRWAAVMMAVALLLLVLAGFRFHSALMFQVAQSKRAFTQTPDRLGVLNEALAAAEKAQRSDPVNPNVGELELDLSLLVAAENREPSRDTSAKLLPRYRELVALRPRWPYARANLVSAKLRAGQIDHETNQELREMIALGPWEPRLQLLAADILYAYGDALEPASRQALLGALDRAVQWQPHEVMDRGERRGQMPFLCSRYSAASRPVKAICERG